MIKVFVHQAAGTVCVLVTLVFGPSNVPLHVVRLLRSVAFALAIGRSVVSDATLGRVRRLAETTRSIL
jgi:hypothetical protein